MPLSLLMPGLLVGLYALCWGLVGFAERVIRPRAVDTDP